MKRTKKEMYIDKMAKQLVELSTKIDLLEIQLRGVAGNMKTGFENKIIEVRNKREELTQKLQDLRESSDTAWEVLKDGVELAWHDVKTAFSEARGKFKKAA